MEYYNKLEYPTDEEKDMLDLAFGLTEKYVPLPWNWPADSLVAQASLNSINTLLLVLSTLPNLIKFA